MKTTIIFEYFIHYQNQMYMLCNKCMYAHVDGMKYIRKLEAQDDWVPGVFPVTMEMHMHTCFGLR